MTVINNSVYHTGKPMSSLIACSIGEICSLEKANMMLEFFKIKIVFEKVLKTWRRKMIKESSWMLMGNFSPTSRTWREMKAFKVRFKT